MTAPKKGIYRRFSFGKNNREKPIEKETKDMIDLSKLPSYQVLKKAK